MTFLSEGNPAWSTDVPNSNFSAGSAEFSSDYIYINEALASTSNRTFVAWFKSTSDSSTQSIFSICNGGYGPGYCYMTLNAAGGTAGDPVQFINTKAYVFATATTTSGYSVSAWHHAAGVYASAASRTAYIDGGNAGSDTTNPGDPFGTNRSVIGAFAVSGFGQYFEGKITEVAAFSTTLDSTTINDIKNNGLNGAGPGASFTATQTFTANGGVIGGGVIR